MLCNNETSSMNNGMMYGGNYLDIFFSLYIENGVSNLTLISLLNFIFIYPWIN